MNFDDLLQKASADEGIVGLNEKPSEHRARDFETILNIVRKINTSLVLSDVLELVIDEAIRITKAERGFLMLADTKRKLEFVVGRDANGNSIQANSFQVSSSVLEDVFTTGESLCIENALNDERFERRQSIMNLELQTILCSPLRTQEETIGVIYVDSKYIQAIDKADVLSLFEILAGQAAVAIKNARLYQDLKSTYEELKQANQQIIQSERMAMKGEIAAEVSHELKNLVGVVLLNLQKLQRKVDNITVDEIRGIVDKTIQGARKIQGFSQSLLARARVGAKLLPGDLNVITTDFLEFIKALPKFKKNNVSAVLAEHVPTVDLDIDQIQQILLNLVNNAVEAFSDTAIELRTEFDKTVQTVTLSVKDTGPGIDPSIMSKLFNEKVTTKVDGHGYGLPICRQILENHGGSIRVESQPGKGAAFIMTFPVSGGN
jgi:signal transduction histidine kinase